MSFSDQLTGVMNRNAYERKVQTLFARGMSLGVIAADVNGLKAANDTLGHAAGDRLIIETAHALANEFGMERTFRTGGDEFLVLLMDFDKKEIENDIALVQEFLQSIEVSTSMGFAYTDRYDGALDPLLKEADKKMYEDKERYYERTGKKRRT